MVRATLPAERVSQGNNSVCVCVLLLLQHTSSLARTIGILQQHPHIQK